jgi:FAD/FMN-containing dehydrogenase
VTLPFNAVVSPGLRLLNAAYYRRSTRTRCVPFQPYFYPLDSIGGWNRLYGQKGFRQFQCLVPEDCAAYVIPELLSASLKHAGGSGLAVLKKFGPSLSPGIMSFPAPGFTLTLDFANKGKTTDRLFSDLESITMQAHGRVNAYKDSKLSQAAFEASYPRWHEMKDYLDPMAGSRFSRRIGLTSARSAAMT